MMLVRDSNVSDFFSSLHGMVSMLCSFTFRSIDVARTVTRATELATAPTCIYRDNRGVFFVSTTKPHEADAFCPLKVTSKNIAAYLKANCAAVIAALIHKKSDCKTWDVNDDATIVLPRIFFTDLAPSPDFIIMPEAHELVRGLATNQLDLAAALELAHRAFHWCSKVPVKMIAQWALHPALMANRTNEYTLTEPFAGVSQLRIRSRLVVATDDPTYFDDYFEAWNSLPANAPVDFSFAGEIGYGKGVTAAAVQHIVADYVQHSAARIYRNANYDVLELLPKKRSIPPCAKCGGGTCRLLDAPRADAKIAAALRFFGERGLEPPYLMSPALFAHVFAIRVPAEDMARIYLLHCRFAAARYDSDTDTSGPSRAPNYYEIMTVYNPSALSQAQLCVAVVRDAAPTPSAALDILSQRFQCVPLAKLFAPPPVPTDETAAIAMLLMLSVPFFDPVIPDLEQIAYLIVDKTKNTFESTYNGYSFAAGDGTVDFGTMDVRPTPAWAEHLQVELQEAREETRKRKFTEGLVIPPFTSLAVVSKMARDLYNSVISKLTTIDYFAFLVCTNTAEQNLALYQAITARQAFPREVLSCATRPHLADCVFEMRRFLEVSTKRKMHFTLFAPTFFASTCALKTTARMRDSLDHVLAPHRFSLVVPDVDLHSARTNRQLPTASTCYSTLRAPFCATLGAFRENMDILVKSGERFDSL